MARLGELLREGFELARGGELAIPEQVRGFLERGMPGELVDVDATVGEHAGVAVDEADGRRRGDDAFESLGGGSEGGHGTFSGGAAFDRAESTYGYSSVQETLSSSLVD